jgi:hypothetical protein
MDYQPLLTYARATASPSHAVFGDREFEALSKLHPQLGGEGLEQYVMRVIGKISIDIESDAPTANELLWLVATKEQKEFFNAPLLRSFCDNFKDRYLANQYERP